MKDFTTLTKEEAETLKQKVWEAAIQNEANYGGCGQCVLGTMMEITGLGDVNVFRSIYGFAGGTGRMGKGTCGALAAATTFISFCTGRTYEAWKDGQDPRWMEAVGDAVRYFEEKYGGYCCCDVQTSIMGKAYMLSDPVQMEAFLAAGGHDDKCTHVCGDTCRFLVDLLVSGRIRPNNSLLREEWISQR